MKRHTILAKDINEAFYSSIKRVLLIGEDYRIRGSNVKELTDFNVIIEDPTKRILTVPYRYNNIFATMAEVFWVFSGRNDMEFLSYFLPNARNYSDDGKIWGGGYGPRLKYYHPNFNRWYLHNNSTKNKDDYFYNGVYKLDFYDQVKGVIKTLKEDPFSRQAIILIPQANIDYDPEITTKDRPCTIMVQFLIRNDKLNCYVRMRSNDVIWGAFNINIFEWTLLQELIAELLNIDVGEYHHNAVSFHLYENMFGRAIKITCANGEYNVYLAEKDALGDPSNQEPPTKGHFEKIEDFHRFIDYAMDLIQEEILLEGAIKETASLQIFNDIFLAYGNPYKKMLEMIIAFVKLKNGRSEESYNLITHMNEPYEEPYVIAGLEYFLRYLDKMNADSEYQEIRYRMMNTNDMFSKQTKDFILGNWSYEDECFNHVKKEIRLKNERNFEE